MACPVIFPLYYALVRTLFEMWIQSGSVDFIEMWGSWERSRQLYQLDEGWKNPREKSKDWKDWSRFALEKTDLFFFFLASMPWRFLWEGQHSVICLCLQKADCKDRGLHKQGETSVGHKEERFQFLGWLFSLGMGALVPRTLELLEKLSVLLLWVVQISTCSVPTRCLLGPHTRFVTSVTW